MVYESGDARLSHQLLFEDIRVGQGFILRITLQRTRELRARCTGLQRQSLLEKVPKYMTTRQDAKAVPGYTSNGDIPVSTGE